MSNLLPTIDELAAAKNHVERAQWLLQTPPSTLFTHHLEIRAVLQSVGFTAGIGMRMLTPRELYNAQGFPPDYVIDGAWVNSPDGVPVWRDFSKSVQVSCVGNSVSPPVAQALVAANCGHLAEQREAA